MEKIPTVEEFLKECDELEGSESWSDDTELLAMYMNKYAILKAKLHVEAALKAANEKAKINRKPTGIGEGSEEITDIEFEGDLGYEDYIPVIYSINEDSILKSYPLDNIK